MEYIKLTRTEKIHIEEVYSVVAELLTSRAEESQLDSNNIARVDNNGLIVCNILASMIEYDSILQKLGIKVIPYSGVGLYKVYCDNENNLKHFTSDIMRYIQ